MTISPSGLVESIFSFVCDANESGIDRIDSLEIFAPETDLMAKMIYIVQVDNHGFSVSAEVQPEGAGYVTGTGFYTAGDTATVTAVTADSCRFVSWMHDGSVVSTQAVYSFVVNEDVFLTANFDCTDVTIPSVDECMVLVYPNPVSHMVTIEGEQLEFIRIFSLFGEEIASYCLNGNDVASLDFSHFREGVYLLSIRAAEKIILKKLVKTSR